MIARLLIVGYFEYRALSAVAAALDPAVLALIATIAGALITSTGLVIVAGSEKNRR